LNEDLSREYQAIIAYVVYSQVLKGAAYMNIADQLEQHAHQELEHGDLALKPPPRIIMKRDRSGHHACDDRRGTQMHQHIASRVDDDCRVQLQPLRGGNRTGRRQSTLFGSAEHLEQSGTSKNRCGWAARSHQPIGNRETL